MFPHFSVSGVGVHSGAPVTATVSPGPPGSGIVFFVDGRAIPARPESLADTPRRTRLVEKGGTIDTVEHFLAAALLLSPCDIEISLSAPELPILDGSAAPWLARFAPSHRRREPPLAPVPSCGSRASLTVRCGESVAEIRPTARDSEAYIEAELNRSALSLPPLIHRYYPASDPFEAIAAARTFIFSHEVAAVRAAGLALGGTLENAVVLTPEGALNPEGLRFPDEPARHKVLDAVGDLSLLGALPRAQITLRHPGHELNREIVRRLSALG